MRIAPTTECEGCGKQIGLGDYVLCQDGIKNKIVAFHKLCNPADPNLQRHHNVTLAPAKLGITVKGIN